MKIRHPFFLKAAGFSIGWIVKFWIGSLRYRRVMEDPTVDPFLPGQARRFIYAFWHETLLLPAMQYRYTPSRVLISQHADGEMIAQACRHLGLGVIRGSTTRGGVEAVRKIMKLEGKYHIVVTPDGPRGPRRSVQPGLVFLASKTRLPIVPVGFGYHWCRQLNSWDRFGLPFPFSPAVGYIGKPLEIPENMGKGNLELWREKTQQAMDRVMAQAEQLAKKERY